MEASSVLTTDPPQTLKERADTEVAVAFGQHGYVNDEGEVDNNLLVDALYVPVKAAVVEKRADRGKVAITRTSLMEIAFPKVPGPDQWAEQDDEELATETWKRLNSTVWRTVDPGINGAIQSRLNSNTGLVLCRTNATPTKEQGVYVTADLQCIVTDFSGPHKAAVKRIADNHAANLAMVIDRLPEYAERLGKELPGGIKNALSSGTAILQPVIDAATSGGELEDDEDDDEQ